MLDDGTNAAAAPPRAEPAAAACDAEWLARRLGGGGETEWLVAAAAAGGLGRLAANDRDLTKILRAEAIRAHKDKLPNKDPATVPAPVKEKPAKPAKPPSTAVSHKKKPPAENLPAETGAPDAVTVGAVTAAGPSHKKKPPAEAGAPDAVTVGAVTSADLWKRLHAGGAVDAKSAEKHFPRLLKLLLNEQSENSLPLINDLKKRLKADHSTAPQFFMPLFDDAAVGKWFRSSDVDGTMPVCVLYKIPEEGGDEALWVTGQLLRPASAGALPLWSISEWDGADIERATLLGRVPSVVAPPGDAPLLGGAPTKAESKPAGFKPGEAKPAKSKPAEAKPVGSKPTEAKPEAKPAEAKPAEAKPAEAKPAEAKPAEAKAEAKPAESKPVPGPAPAPVLGGPGAKPPTPLAEDTVPKSGASAQEYIMVD
ncbi:hypothetical protein M885DRAFT_530789 [Pelagophyceae sp. CCMP2097]|nr:hypothetical protein M885DRAFT_530789 [Pelagophyceae sp. CCMP2097]